MAIDTRTIRLFAQYVTIGGLVFIVDVGVFQLMVLRGALLPVAATAGYVLGLATHFSLNRAFNFRNFDRPWREQATTYGAVVFAQWLLTLAIIESCVHGVHTTPIIGKITAVAINVPVGFLSHRYLTFGPGILARLRQLLFVLQK